MNKFVLFVMTEKGYGVTKRLVAEFPNAVERVVIGRDKNVENDYNKEIRDVCENASIEWRYREDGIIVDASVYIFAISWRWMIDHPQDRLIVFHDSILPKYRGFAPLVNMLIKGQKKIGVSTIFGSSEYDRGDIIEQRETEIQYPIKISDAIKINNKNFLELALNVASKISQGVALSAKPQNEEEATYSIWREYDDYFIDWSKSSEEILRLIDAVGFPYLGARTTIIDGKLVVIDEAEVVEDVVCELRHYGKVIFVCDGFPTIICGDGLLKITKARLIDGNEESSFLPLKGFRFRFK